MYIWKKTTKGNIGKIKISGPRFLQSSRRGRKQRNKIVRQERYVVRSATCHCAASHYIRLCCGAWNLGESRTIDRSIDDTMSERAVLVIVSILDWKYLCPYSEEMHVETFRQYANKDMYADTKHTYRETKCLVVHKLWHVVRTLMSSSKEAVPPNTS